ncbi:MAG: hypothetical protein COA54_09780 [Thiotrichaceae bacterium]|nr:MAG: hypothetical protein COA54_09780 [Thiotrichaceae bacterium]
MKSFILHVYPRDIRPESPPGHHEIVGVVESVEDEKQTPFTSPQELWKILVEAENQPGSEWVKNIVHR